MQLLLLTRNKWNDYYYHTIIIITIIIMENVSRQVKTAALLVGTTTTTPLRRQHNKLLVAHRSDWLGRLAAGTCLWCLQCKERSPSLCPVLDLPLISIEHFYGTKTFTRPEERENTGQLNSRLELPFRLRCARELNSPVSLFPGCLQAGNKGERKWTGEKRARRWAS